MNHQVTVGGEAGRHLELSLQFSQVTTIGLTIRHCAEVQPDRPAIASSGFAPLSYRELQGLIDEVRARLRSAGFSRQARIAIAIPNGPQAALAIVAVACSAVTIPLNPRQTLREIEMGFAKLAPDAVLLARGDDSDARRAAERNGLAIIEATPSKEGTLGFGIVEQQAGTAATSDEPDEPDPDATAFILQTSGTEAEPKLIPFSHRNMLAVAARIQAWFHLTPQDRCLSVSPPFYSHGLKVTVLTPLLTGGTVAFPNDASKFNYAEWFGSLKPTWYSAGPTLHQFIYDQTKSKADAKTGHSLRFITGGGAPLSLNVLEGLQNTLGVPVAEHYGSSEAALVASNHLPPGPFKPGTCGLPWQDTLIIVSDDGRRLPPGEKGEILVGGPSLISGYLEAPELNRASFVNGWFKTGDIGSLDDEGFLTLHGRKNDLINRGGEKISPVEIDRALMSHPAVAEAAAFPAQHARLGEDVAAAVVLHPGMTASADDLRRYLQDQLTSFKIPGRIIIEDQLPKGKTGKVLRRQLSESFKKRTAAETRIAAPRLNENATPDSTLVIQLTEIWERLLQTASLSPDDDFSESGGDSLLAMEMLSELERLVGKTIPISTLIEARTIRQLAQKLTDLNGLEPKLVMKFNESGDQAPLFFFHGDYDGGFYTARLANLLGPNQPLFTIPPHGFNGEPVPPSIQAMAADRLQLILSAQAKGPYRLCGFCNGAFVAFEVARALIAVGEKVEFVGMIDNPTLNVHHIFRLFASAMSYARPIFGTVSDRAVSWMWHRCIWLETLFNLPARERLGFIGNNVRGALFGTRPAREIIVAPRQTHRALGTYLPMPLEVPVIYFSAEYGSTACRRLSANFEMIKVCRKHDEIVRDRANLGKIAGYLTARLRPAK